MFVESHMNLRSSHSVPSLTKDENAKLSVDLVVCLTYVRTEDIGVCVVGSRVCYALCISVLEMCSF